MRRATHKQNADRRTGKRLWPWWVVMLVDILALGAALCVFSLFHHVLPRYGGGPIRSIVSVQAFAPNASEAPVPSADAVSPAAAPARTDGDAPLAPVPSVAAVPGDFSAAFPYGDTGAGKLHSYQSENIRIAIDAVSQDGITYYVADIWVKSIASLRTAFAKGRYGQGIHQDPGDIAEANNAILAISGDYYGARPKGIVIRNGDLYRDSLFGDVCVLYQDGVMETYPKNDFNIDEAIDRGAYQAWSFGPGLLTDGEPLTEFDSSVSNTNPRCAIGYYEPGHYCFVLVDGRQEGYSNGMTLAELSQLFYDLGCKSAYNLDGGQTAMMYFEGRLVNQPYNGGRQSSDIVYIGE